MLLPMPSRYRYRHCSNGYVEVSANFQKALDRFNLRVKETKTRICELPLPAAEPWQTEMYAASRRQIGNVQELVAFFDVTFSLKNKYPDSYVLNYAIGLLFKLPSLDGHALRVSESVLTQAILTEAGSVHKCPSGGAHRGKELTARV